MDACICACVCVHACARGRVRERVHAVHILPAYRAVTLARDSDVSTLCAHSTITQMCCIVVCLSILFLILMSYVSFMIPGMRRALYDADY